MTSTLRLLAAIDELYARTVTEPDRWHEQAFHDWAGDLNADGLTKEQARAVRRALGMARKLRDFWADPARIVDADDWRSRIDVAFGARAWRPTLELAIAGLDAEPSPELFDEVRTRFRVVNNELWLEGVEYADWAARRTDR